MSVFFLKNKGCLSFEVLFKCIVKTFSLIKSSPEAILNFAVAFIVSWIFFFKRSAIIAKSLLGTLSIYQSKTSTESFTDPLGFSSLVKCGVGLIFEKPCTIVFLISLSSGVEKLS